MQLSKNLVSRVKRVYNLHNYLLASLFWDYRSLVSLSNCDRAQGTKYMIKYLSWETCQCLWSVLIEFKRESIWSPSFLGGQWLIAQPTSSNVIFLSDNAPLRKPLEQKPQPNRSKIIRFVSALRYHHSSLYSSSYRFSQRTGEKKTHNQSYSLFCKSP